MIETMRSLLGVSACFNVAVLYSWFLTFTFAHQRLYQWQTRHSGWDVSRFNQWHYRALARIKNFTITCLLVPSVILHLYLMAI
ncbi:DUF6868 family protein [Thaumasiovibrio subtropicus]|uniref:DUF6868 family protein n=1 Tax=Thaumasiovibrio subtropicus TaxID=1891207 RepID=UPI000B363884|nr:hypothetical protein [Thaumasiovibrio subtropicus]